MSGDLDAILELGDFPWSAPVASGDPSFGNVISLLHFNDANGTTIPVDQIPGVTWSNGAPTHAVVSNGNPKYGSGSLQRVAPANVGGIYTVFSGVSNVLIRPTTLYTIETWVYFSAFSSSTVYGSNFNRFLYLVAPVNVVGMNVSNSSGDVLLIEFSASTILGTTTITKNVWHHVAVTSDGVTIRAFLDGNLEGSRSSLDITGATPGLTYSVGDARGANGDYWVGYNDDARFTLGVCRYTSNFTPPTSEFPNTVYLPATGGGGIVFPTSGSTLAAIGSTGGVIQSAEVHLLFNPDGTVYWGIDTSPYPDLPANVNGLTRAFNWVYPNQIDTGSLTAPGASYWIRCVPISGGVPGPTVWTPLTSQVRFVLSNPTGNVITERFNIQIASDSNGNNIVCNSTGWTFSSFTVGGQYAGIVSPLVGGTYTTGSLFSARISLSIYKDGTGAVIVTRDESDPQYVYTSRYPFNWYIPNSSDIGSSYWIKITPIIGSLSSNNAATVVSLYNGVTCGLLNVSTGGTIVSCQFKVEIFSDAAGIILVSSGLYTFNCRVS